MREARTPVYLTKQQVDQLLKLADTITGPPTDTQINQYGDLLNKLYQAKYRFEEGKVKE